MLGESKINDLFDIIKSIEIRTEDDLFNASQKIKDHFLSYLKSPFEIVAYNEISKSEDCIILYPFQVRDCHKLSIQVSKILGNNLNVDSLLGQDKFTLSNCIIGFLNSHGLNNKSSLILTNGNDTPLSDVKMFIFDGVDYKDGVLIDTKDGKNITQKYSNQADIYNSIIEYYSYQFCFFLHYRSTVAYFLQIAIEQLQKEGYLLQFINMKVRESQTSKNIIAILTEMSQQGSQEKGSESVN